FGYSILSLKDNGNANNQFSVITAALNDALGDGANPRILLGDGTLAPDVTFGRIGVKQASIYDSTLVVGTPTASGHATTKAYVDSAVLPKVGSTASSATPTINTDNVNLYRLTAQAANITSFTTNLSGTPTHGQTL